MFEAVIGLHVSLRFIARAFTTECRSEKSSREHGVRLRLEMGGRGRPFHQPGGDLLTCASCWYRLNKRQKIQLKTLTGDLIGRLQSLLLSLKIGQDLGEVDVEVFRQGIFQRDFFVKQCVFNVIECLKSSPQFAANSQRTV